MAAASTHARCAASIGPSSSGVSLCAAKVPHAASSSDIVSNISMRRCGEGPAAGLRRLIDEAPLEERFVASECIHHTFKNVPPQ